MLHEEKDLQLQAFLMLFWTIVRWLASPCLSSTTITLIKGALKVLAESSSKYWSFVFGQKKSHDLFMHLQEDLDWGTPYDFTSAPFEAQNKPLKSLRCMKNTHSFDDLLLEKFLIRRAWENDAYEIFKNADNPNFAAACEVFLPDIRGVKKYCPPPLKQQLSDNSYVVILRDGKRIFAMITEVDGETYHVLPFKGKGLLAELCISCADSPVQDEISRFIPQGEFGLIITGVCETTLTVAAHEIISHCCCITTVFEDGMTGDFITRRFVISLEYRGPNK